MYYIHLQDNSQNFLRELLTKVYQNYKRVTKRVLQKGFYQKGFTKGLPKADVVAKILNV